MSTLKTHNLQSPDAGSVNIALAPNAGMVVAGLSTYSNQINVGSNIKLGNAGVITATTFVGNLTGNPTGTLQTAAQPNITSVGTLSALTVSGNINVTSSDPTIVFVDSDNNPDFDIKAGGGRFAIRDSTNNAERLRITSDGNVLVGDHTAALSTYNSTQPRLSIYKSGGSGGYLELGGNIPHNGHSSGTILFINNDNSEATSNNANGKILAMQRVENVTSDTNAGDDCGGDLVFMTKPEAGSLNERLRIGSAGQFGIAGANYGNSGEVLTSQGSSSAPVWAKAGITMADQWRITSSISLGGAVSTLSSNWARVASPSGYGKIGSAMSESSGFFSFPSTGIYLIEFTILLAATSAQRYLGHRVQTTVDNFSSAQNVAEQLGHMGINNSFGAYHTSSSSYIFDVTNTSTHKIRFAAVAFTPSGTSAIGNANQNSTFATFIRLGDT